MHSCNQQPSANEGRDQQHLRQQQTTTSTKCARQRRQLRKSSSRSAYYGYGGGSVGKQSKQFTRRRSHRQSTSREASTQCMDDLNFVTVVHNDALSDSETSAITYDSAFDYSVVGPVSQGSCPFEKQSTSDRTDMSSPRKPTRKTSNETLTPVSVPGRFLSQSEHGASHCSPRKPSRRTSIEMTHTPPTCAPLEVQTSHCRTECYSPRKPTRRASMKCQLPSPISAATIHLGTLSEHRVPLTKSPRKPQRMKSNYSFRYSHKTSQLAVRSEHSVHTSPRKPQRTVSQAIATSNRPVYSERCVPGRQRSDGTSENDDSCNSDSEDSFAEYQPACATTTVPPSKNDSPRKPERCASEVVNVKESSDNNNDTVSVKTSMAPEIEIKPKYHAMNKMGHESIESLMLDAVFEEYDGNPEIPTTRSRRSWSSETPKSNQMAAMPRRVDSTKYLQPSSSASWSDSFASVYSALTDSVSSFAAVVAQRGRRTDV